jgi:segregation and condensation protein B
MEGNMTQQPQHNPDIENQISARENIELSENSQDPAPADVQSEFDEDEQDLDTEPAEERSLSSPDNPDFHPTVESVVEAVLFASDEPLNPARLAEICETNIKQIRKHVQSLNTKYQDDNHAFRIEQIAGGYQMLTLAPYSHWLRKMLRAREDTKLSAAALETLAIVAYKQPIIRADIEAIRGVAAGEVIRSLMYKGLVKILGRAEVIGRPMLYGTTKKFLEVFGLNSLKDLPKIEELKKPPA